jgi:hypothetical protein
MKNKLRNCFVIFIYCIINNLSFAQTHIKCNSFIAKQLINSEYRTVEKNNNEQYWIVSEDQKLISWGYIDKYGSAKVDHYKVLNTELADDNNSMTFTIIGLSMIKSILTINSKTNKISWMFHENEYGKLKFYFYEYNIEI